MAVAKQRSLDLIRLDRHEFTEGFQVLDAPAPQCPACRSSKIKPANVNEVGALECVFFFLAGGARNSKGGLKVGTIAIYSASRRAISWSRMSSINEDFNAVYGR